MNIFAQKKILRQEMTSRRKAIESSERERLSRIILQKLFAQSEYQDAKTIMAYASMPEEIQLRELFDEVLASEKNLAIPFIVGRGEMRPVLVPSVDALGVGDFGILTVRQDARKFISAEEIDCIIVPGAAFDIHGNRLGLGGGYYDRFLKLAANAKKIALAFDFQVLEKIPVAENDLPVNKIITEKRIIA